MSRKNTLIVLSSLLLLSLGGLFAWYLFFFRCQTLSENYDIFGKHISQNNCSSATISLKGMLYNMQKEGKNLKFDISTWNTESKKVEKITNITIPFDENTATQLAGVEYLAPVELTLNLQKKYKYTFIPDNNLSEKWTLKKITYSKSDYLQFLRDLFYVITFKAVEIDGKTFEYSILSTIETQDNGEKKITTIGENNLTSLYRMYVLLSGTRNKEIDYENLYTDFTVNSYMDSLSSFLKNDLTADIVEQEDSSKNEDEIFLKSGYIGGCTFVKRIIDEFNISEVEQEKLIEEYCNIGKVADTLISIKRLNFPYTINDFLASINSDRLQESKYDEQDLINISLPSDLLSTAELVSADNNKENDIYNISSLLIVNNLLEGDENINLKNFCGFLNSNYFSKKLFNQNEIINNNAYRILLDQDIAKMAEYMSNDIQAGLLCLIPESSDKYVEEFNNAILAKYLTVDWFNSSEEKDHALWDGNVYRIIDNARLYEILLRYYEDTK